MRRNASKELETGVLVAASHRINIISIYYYFCIKYLLYGNSIIDVFCPVIYNALIVLRSFVCHSEETKPEESNSVA
jgi:hypothetical protein